MQGKHPIPWAGEVDISIHFVFFWVQQFISLSQKHTAELGHDHHSGKGWTWTHQQISHDTSADGCSSSVCVPIRGVGGDDHDSSGASDWTSWEIRNCYKTSLDGAGRNTTSSSPDELYPGSQWWEKVVSPHDSGKSTVFPWCGHPQPMPMWPLHSSSC